MTSLELGLWSHAELLFRSASSNAGEWFHEGARSTSTSSSSGTFSTAERVACMSCELGRRSHGEKDGGGELNWGFLLESKCGREEICTRTGVAVDTESLVMLRVVGVNLGSRLWSPGGEVSSDTCLAKLGLTIGVGFVTAGCAALGVVAAMEVDESSPPFFSSSMPALPMFKRLGIFGRLALLLSFTLDFLGVGMAVGVGIFATGFLKGVLFNPPAPPPI